MSVLIIICVIVAIFVVYELYKRNRSNNNEWDYNNIWNDNRSAKRLTERYNSDSEQISHGLNVYDAYPQIFNNSYYGQFRDLGDTSFEVVYTEDPNKQRYGLYY